MTKRRSKDFNNRQHGRYWWFAATNPKYVPPIFEFLTDEEWSIMDEWYSETELTHAHGTGECNVPAICALMGLIMGNNVSRILQLGHFIGFSTLLIGFMGRRMQHESALFSVDIDPVVTAITQRWIDRAALRDYVKLVVSDSSNPGLVSEATTYLRGKPQVMFIDSSHECDHTIAELRLWIQHIQPGGFAILHDVSEFARSFDSAGRGGVKEAVARFSTERQLQCIIINDFCGPEHFGDRNVYKDACGLGIIQIPS